MRGTGTTTQQLKSAPTHSLFIWCTHDTHYPRSILKRLKRDDVTVLPITALDQVGGIAGSFSAIIVDHATESTPNRHRKLALLMQTNIFSTEQDDDHRQRTLLQISIANHIYQERHL